MKERVVIPIYQVDAFTDENFSGNPAAVCILPYKIEDEIMQYIAFEMNLSETAFLLNISEKPIKKSEVFSLRWFTPEVEVPLCGHATLATAKVLFSDVGIKSRKITFKTLSGDLNIKKEKDGILLNFPSGEPEPIDPIKRILEVLRVKNAENFAYSRKLKEVLIHLDSEEQVKNLNPNFEEMKKIKFKLNILGIIVTSLGSPPYDFISRFFAPWVGINEDPVTGAAHTVLTPYWAKILNKKEMLAYQVSKRGGKIKVRLSSKNRVDLIGEGVIVLKGELYL
jgi:PhzF family phenazine biosynthesis protein